MPAGPFPTELLVPALASLAAGGGGEVTALPRDSRWAPSVLPLDRLHTQGADGSRGRKATKTAHWQK